MSWQDCRFLPNLSHYYQFMLYLKIFSYFNIMRQIYVISHYHHTADTSIFVIFI